MEIIATESDELAVPEKGTSRSRMYVLLAIIVLLVGGIGIAIAISPFRSDEPGISGEAYFTYTDEELASLAELTSSQTIQPFEAYLWDEEVFKLVSRAQFPDTRASRVYAYLAIAQREAAIVASHHGGKPLGNLTAVSEEVLCLFFENECDSLGHEEGHHQDEVGSTTDFPHEDAYSRAVADIVIEKVRARLTEEEALTETYVLREGAEYWSGPNPIGLETAHWKPWFLTSRSQFRVPDPVFTKDQLTATKEALDAVTNEQKKATVLWAGGPGTKTPPGQWLSIADEYLREENAPLQKVLDVRAVTAAAAADAVIAVFDSKYAYGLKRPFMMDPSINTIMPTPSHPSYPAGHSTISAACGAVLTHYFPEKGNTITALVEEAGMSRIWGGIHFPMDHEQGLILGRNVGQQALAHFGQ